MAGTTDALFAQGGLVDHDFAAGEDYTAALEGSVTSSFAVELAGEGDCAAVRDGADVVELW